MSYVVSPYAVDLEGLRLIGSYGQEFVDDIVRSAPANVLERLDEAEDVGLTPGDVIRQLLRGEPMHRDFGPSYGHALEALCRHSGTQLNNAHWAGMRFGYFALVQNALAEIGVDFDPSELVLSGSPVNLPEIEDFPSIGYLDNREIKSLAEIFADADLDRLADDTVRASVADLVEWLRVCQDNGTGLVCFYY
ncbi:hypothetical protein ABZ319_26370 [Nocardia sp. NPDC005978]|uniref:DUF7691 family protein n=1 Tax=Nocardia sp. NPDC005978 TaxID=3156725 RepID=UPI0033A376CE